MIPNNNPIIMDPKNFKTKFNIDFPIKFTVE